jgi:NDP-sugar pyrophosphorylase family protein
MILDELFPQMKIYSKSEMIPEWQENDFPWSILDARNENNLQVQINNYCKSSALKISSTSKYSIDTNKGPVFIDKSADIHENVKIEGPCFVGPNTEIRHTAYLRSGSWISENAIVGHASEIKNSILLPGAKAPHFNYVGDSILGFGVNLGAGTKLSNVRNDRRDIRLTYNNDLFNTGMKKMGAIIGDFSEIGCNVVTNPGTIISPKSMVSPNNTITGHYF